MPTCIDVKFIFNSVRLGLSSSANIKYSSPGYLLAVFAMFVAIIYLVPAVVLTLEMSEVSAIFFFHDQNHSTSSTGLLGNSALTCSGLHFLRHFLVKHKILPNLVISNQLW